MLDHMHILPGLIYYVKITVYKYNRYVSTYAYLLSIYINNLHYAHVGFFCHNYKQ